MTIKYDFYYISQNGEIQDVSDSYDTYNEALTAAKDNIVECDDSVQCIEVIEKRPVAKVTAEKKVKVTKL